MGVNPENGDFEDADGTVGARRQHPTLERLGVGVFRGLGLTSRLQGFALNRRGPASTAHWSWVDGRQRGTTGVAGREWASGIGLSHSSVEAREGNASGRAGGAKGRAEQGFRWRER